MTADLTIQLLRDFESRNVTLQKLGFNDGLNITTDYRTVLADVLFNRMGATKDQINNAIFPGLNFGGPLGYTDLGLLGQKSLGVSR